MPNHGHLMNPHHSIPPILRVSSNSMHEHACKGCNLNQFETKEILYLFWVISMCFSSVGQSTLAGHSLQLKTVTQTIYLSLESNPDRIYKFNRFNGGSMLLLRSSLARNLFPSPASTSAIFGSIRQQLPALLVLLLVDRSSRCVSHSLLFFAFLFFVSD